MMVASMFLAACGGDTDDDVVDDGPAVDQPSGDDDDPSDDDDDAIDDDARRGGTLRFGDVEADGYFNPLYYSSSYDGFVTRLIFNSLMYQDYDGEWVMEIAAEFPEISDDGSVITFTLRDDVVFSDGEPVTAHDVVFTYQMLADPSYSGRYTSVADGLVGFNESRDGEGLDNFGVVALDDHTVQFTFREGLRTNVVNTTMSVMPKHYYGANVSYGDVDEHLNALNTRPLGAGPYVLEQYRPAQDALLTRNPLYMNEDQFLIEEIEYIFTTRATEMEDLVAENLDLLTGQIEADNIRRAEAEPHINLNSYPRSGYGYIKTNHEFGPTTEKAVRQALYYSFNLDEFVEGYFEGYAATQFHPYSQVSWVMTDDFAASLPDYSFDMDKAREILDDAGWTLNANGVRERDGEILELFVLAMPDHDILDTLIPMWQRDWGNGLGIELNVSYEEFGSILETVIYESDNNVEEWSMFFLATTISSYDPHGTVEGSFHSRHIGSGRNNTSRYSNPRVDELIDQGETIMDIEEAIPVYQEIGRILTEDAAFMPVYANTYFDFYNERLRDFDTHAIFDWVSAMRYAWLEW